MKLTKWMFGAMALALMASCSDDLKDGPAMGGGTPEDGDGYISINIKLPTVNGTRANDDFDDGVEDEYIVKDAVLLLFQGATEATAQFTGGFNLQQADPAYDEGTDQITRHSIRVANVKGLNPENNLYALVMVNGIANGLYNQNNPVAEWMYNKDEEGNRTGKTIKEFQEYVLNAPLFYQTTKGSGYASQIFMTNSPLSTVAGGLTSPGVIGNALPVLVQLDKTTYPTTSLAIANPAGTIHVERAVGKVTVSNFEKTTGMTVSIDEKEYTLEVDKVWWDMAQDLAETYVVRNTNRRQAGTTSTANMWAWSYGSTLMPSLLGEDINYRMIGESPITVKENIKYYRPYFCQVPGYNVPKTAGDKTYEKKNFTKETMEFKDAIVWETTDDEDKNFVSPGAFYPRENTFPVEYMKFANTTRIGFWVSFKFKNGDTYLSMTDKNFYINGMDKTHLYMDVKVDDKTYLNPLENLAMVELSNTDKYSDLWKNIKDALDRTGTGSITGVELSKLVTITSEIGDDGGISIKEIKFRSYEDIEKTYPQFEKAPSYSFAPHMATLNNLGVYYQYTGGKVFYEVRIKHFGDDLTPWNGDKLTFATSIEESYGKNSDVETRNNNFLGRYGIVRNNWYDLNVKKIARLGDPQDPAKWNDKWDDNPDDNKEQYIAVELRVLSWAKRSQEVEF